MSKTREKPVAKAEKDRGIRKPSAVEVLESFRGKNVEEQRRVMRELKKIERTRI